MTELQQMTGIVKNLKISKNYEDFAFTQVDKNIAGGAVIGAVAMGQLFNSAALVNASGGAEIDVECFTCSVNETLLFGRFHKVQFKNDDNIEFVINPTEHGGVVHAARNSKLRILWMLPHQMRGHVAQKKSDFKWAFLLSFFIPLLFTFIFWWKLPTDGSEPIWLFPIFFLCLFSGFFIVIAWAFSRLYGHSKIATEVIRTLGYKNPENIDLPALSKIAEKRIHKLTGRRSDLLSPWSFWY